MLFDMEPHDIFISYAREDSEWVRQNLYQPLRACRTVQGRPPRIFFDVGEDGIQIGQNFQKAIDKAIEKARRFIPVYSATYFQKEMCLYELELARMRDLAFQRELLLPILIDEAGVEKIPFVFKPVNFLSVNTDRQWFLKLCLAMGLQQSAEELTLTFLEQPGDVFANHTLPVVRVAVQCGGVTEPYNEDITIRAEPGTLLGSTTVSMREGIASFDDLSLADAVDETRLIARSATLGEAMSEPFGVYSRTTSMPTEAARPEEPGQVTIPAAGEAVFFATGRHLAIIQPQRLLAYSVEGRPILEQPLAIRTPLRLVRRRGGRLVVGDWHGNVHLICDDGRCREWRFGESAHGFVVPADIDIDEEYIYVSFWSGSVFRLADSGEAELVLKNPAGVQALGIYEDHVFTCDFAGNLHVYRNGRLVNSAMVEPVIWLLMGTPTGLVGVGDRNFYHISSGGRRVIDFAMPLQEVAAVDELSELPIVMDTDGKGIRFDSNLVISASIYTQPGAKPVSADNQGTYCVFRNPDATRTLLVGDRIVFSHARGCLAISPQGDRFAMGDESSTRILSREAMDDVILRAAKEVETTKAVPDSGARD